MTNPQLLDYIRTQLAAGVSKEQIQAALTTQGWTTQDINEAFATPQPSPTTVLTPKPVFNNRKIIFSSIVGVVIVLAGVGVAFAAPSIRTFIAGYTTPQNSSQNTIATSTQQTNGTSAEALTTNPANCPNTYPSNYQPSTAVTIPSAKTWFKIHS